MKNKIKSILSVILVLMLLISVMPISAFAIHISDKDKDSEANHSHDGWTAWGDTAEEQNSLPNAEGDYYLANDITVSKTWTTNYTVHLCLNGHVIRYTGDTGSVIYLDDQSHMCIYDCSNTDRYLKCVSGGAWEVADTIKPTDGKVINLEDYTLSTPSGTYVKTTGGCITGGKSGAIIVHAYQDYALSLYGGNIVGNTNSSNGGGVDVSLGTFMMLGGNIVGNYAKSRGGGVSVYNGAGLVAGLNFYAKGGCIAGNTAGTCGGGISETHGLCAYLQTDNDVRIFGNKAAASGGGIYSVGLAHINGGTIEGNKAGTYGGGMYSADETYINGGTFKGNSAGKWGGGVYSNSTGNVVMNNGLITKNSAPSGAGVYDNCKFTMNGGTISDNSATTSGGGVFIGSQSDSTDTIRQFKMNGGDIINNSAKYGGGIYAGVACECTVKDGKINGNKAAVYGGGIDIDTDAKVNLNNCSIAGNTAGANGGGVCWARSTTCVGGSLKVTDNKLNSGKANNVLVAKDAQIVIGDGSNGADALKDGAAIGITLASMTTNDAVPHPFTSNGSESDIQYFFADNTDRNYGPQYNEEGYLDIVLLHYHENENKVNFQEWTSPDSLPKNGGNWFLSTDVTLNRPWVPKKDTRLCLNGHVLKLDNDYGIEIEEVNFDLYDCDSIDAHPVHYFEYVKGGAWTYVGDAMPESGTVIALEDFTLDKVSKDGEYYIAVSGGCVVGSNYEIISVYSDLSEEPKVDFRMHGGTLIGATSDNAETVRIQGDCTFTMTGGTIAGNSNVAGSIVSNYFGSIELLGGSILGNTCSEATIFTRSNTNILAAGTVHIHDNVSELGAVYGEDDDITVGGTAQIAGNVTSAGAEKNVSLKKGFKIVLADGANAPKEDMHIGVTTQVNPTAETPVLFTYCTDESSEDYFFSDNNYGIKFKPLENSKDALYVTLANNAASTFGNGSVWIIIALAAVVIAGGAAVVISRKKNGTKKNSEGEDK